MITTQKKENAKYRVCIVSAILPPAYGGAEVAAFLYANRLLADPESDIIVIGWDRTGAYSKSGRKIGFVHDVSFPENPHDARGVFVYFQQYAHMISCFKALIHPMWKYRDRYDIVHNFNSGFAFNRVAIFIAKLLGKKAVTETSLVGDDDPLSLGRFTSWKDYLKPKFIRYRFYKMADGFVSKSPVISEIYARSEIPPEKVYEIPYSVDTAQFAPVDAGERKLLRKKLGLWEDGRIVLFVGGINERKGVHLLVDAFAEVSEQHKDLRLVIAGPTYKYDPQYIQGLKDKVAMGRIGDKVMFTESIVNNVDEYMKSSDIFVLPSKKEGFPISIIEAMSSGLAVIGSDIPEIAKAQIDNGRDGIVFRQGSKEELAGSLRMLLASNGKLNEIGLYARQKAVDNWSTVIVDKKYKELYDDLLQPGIVGRSGNETGKRRKIRVLFTIPNFNTAGSGRALLNVVERLDKDRFEPEICCRHERGVLFQLARNTGVPVHISNFTTLMKPRLRAVRNVYRLSRFFKRLNPDIIHSYNYSDDYSEALAARMAGIKWLYTKKNMSWGSNAWKIRTFLSNAIVPQNSDMVKEFFPENNNLNLIPIGIDVSEFAASDDVSDIKSRYDIESSRPVIITIANVIPIKGIEFLIKGFELILEDLPEAKLLIIGEDKTEYADTLKEELIEKGLESNVIFTGRQSEIRPFFRVADIFILSSTKTGEGGPISVLEAMASGVLCYGSDVSGIRDQFKELPDQLFESENPGAIANKILHAVRLTKEEKEARIRKQYEFIMEHYSIENEVKKLEQLYKNLAGVSKDNGARG
ncbi:MAG: glycosyltransferase [Ignavibacteria bacterium]|nr:glycosyltransferase [Ignavibacteria bacterium]